MPSHPDNGESSGLGEHHDDVVRLVVSKRKAQSIENELRQALVNAESSHTWLRAEGLHEIVELLLTNTASPSTMPQLQWVLSRNCARLSRSVLVCLQKDTVVDEGPCHLTPDSACQSELLACISALRLVCIVSSQVRRALAEAGAVKHLARHLLSESEEVVISALCGLTAAQRNSSKAQAEFVQAQGLEEVIRLITSGARSEGCKRKAVEFLYLLMMHLQEELMRERVGEAVSEHTRRVVMERLGAQVLDVFEAASMDLESPTFEDDLANLSAGLVAELQAAK